MHAHAQGPPATVPRLTPPVLRWVQPHLTDATKKPNNISQYSQGFQDYFQQVLDGYTHIQERMPLPRFLEQTQAGENLCLTGLLKTPEREEILVFSDAVGTTPMPCVYMREDVAMRLGLNSGKVSLAWLMDQPDVRAVFHRARSYGPLDAIIKPHLNGDRFFESTLITGALAEMLARNRVDFFIEYPLISDRLRIDGRMAFFKVLRITELPEHTPFYAGCTNNDWGKRVVASINKALRDGMKTERYHHLFTAQGLNAPATTVNALERLYQEFIAQGKDGGQMKNTTLVSDK